MDKRRQAWWVIRLVAIALLFLANEGIKARDLCLHCVSCRSGSCCSAEGSGGGFTDCQGSRDGGCSPNGGSAC